MNEYNTNSGSTQPRFNSSLLTLGIGIVLLGCLLTLKDLMVFGHSFSAIKFWPAILIILGFVKLIEHKFRYLSGWIITILGSLLLLHSLGGYSFTNLVGPAILMVAGVYVVLLALRRHRRVPPELQKSGDFVHGTAILSGYKHKPNGGLFDGGEITAIFGSFELDLRKMTMKHESARIDVFAMFGGGEIIVPDEWEVSVVASAIAGAMENKVTQPPTTDCKHPKLLITGTALFGGVEVK